MTKLDSQMLDILEKPQNWSEEEIQENNLRVRETLIAMDRRIEFLEDKREEGREAHRLVSSAVSHMNEDREGSARDDLRVAMSHLNCLNFDNARRRRK